MRWRHGGRMKWPAARIAWILGTAAVLVLDATWWSFSQDELRVPLTPADNVNATYASQWMLLQQAAEVIPPWEGYTTVAPDCDSEMLLYMLSLGVLLDRYGWPNTYWCRKVAWARDVRYVIDYGCTAPPQGRLVRRLPGGCVWDRRGADR